MKLDLLTVYYMDYWVLIVSFVLFYGGKWFMSNWGRNYPPGPIGLPVVGYLPFVVKDPHLKLPELAKRFGDVFGFYLGSRYCVVLNNVELVKSTFNKQAFSGRPAKSNLCPEQFGTSISSVNGKDWVEQRKFVFHTLGGLGKDKNLVEELIKEEVHHFLQALQKTNSLPKDIQNYLSSSVSNVVTLILFGKRFDYDDKVRKFLDYSVQQQTVYTAQMAYHNYMPWTEKFPVLNRYMGLHHYKEVFDKLLRLIEQEIEEHKISFDPNHIRDFLDYFLSQMKRNEENRIEDSSFTEEMLIGTSYTLLVAGSETVKTSLDWAFYVLAANPAIQDKVRQEIDDVIGRERSPCSHDMKLMPYTQSFLMELHRYHTVLPINIIRYTLEDTVIAGYDIPRNTTIISNIWAIHNDPNHWIKPEIFLPERFLSEDGKSVIKSDSFMPFSTGKRQCPGEAMASIEIFVFVTSTLQKFHLRIPDGVIPDLKPVLHISAQPKSHELIFENRT